MIYSLFFAFLSTIIIYFSTNSISSFVFSYFILSIGSVVIFTFKKEYRVAGLKIFYIVFSVFSLLALFHYFDYYLDYSSFAQDWIDEYKFFSVTEHYRSIPISQIFEDCFVHRIHKINEGYIFYISSISSIATSFFDGNHLLLQFLGTVLWGTLMCVLLFRLLLFYIDIDKAYKYTLFYSFFTVSTVYSVLLLRDIVISFFFLWGLIVVSKRYSLKGLFLLILITFLVFEIRYEHGIFFILFIIYYLYNKFKKQKFLFLILACFISILSSPLIIDQFTNISQTLTGYSEYHQEGISNRDDSLGSIIWSLPTPLKELFIVFYSQLKPFPPWISLLNSNNIFQATFGVLPIFYSIFWFIVLYTILKWFVIYKKYKYISIEIKLLLIIALIMLVSNTASGNVRRIMCVFPIIYLIYVVIIEKIISRNNKLKTKIEAMSIYLLMIVFYLFIKIIF